MDTVIKHAAEIRADRLYSISPLPVTLTDVLTEDEKLALIKQRAMRDHPFVGDGPHCETWLSGDPLATENGSWSFRSECGYPVDLHPEEG